MLRWLFFLLCFSFSAFAEKTVVIYPYQRMGDMYPLELLKLALSKHEKGRQYQLQESPLNITQGRSLLLISKDRDMNIAWSMTSNQRESMLVPIKIPIYKGLFGYRLFLIHKDLEDRFPNTLSLNQLSKERVAIQGVDWPDLEILKHNQFDVMSVKHFDAMFELINKKRVDYFPRSILEIWNERENFGNGNLMVEKNLALHYPTYIFYFVSKNNIELAQAVREGLLSSISDGSFDSLFNTFKGAALQNANMKGRTVFRLDNPNVSRDDVYQWPSLVE